ncbi:hypothetical protein ACH5Y9_18285 [Methylomonas sp. BW4-1]|uniref:hypothetical protein n=1 Tax=Methylomonas sp. BW4-1 TaxID=3376685 RepID=UPI004041FF2B
MKIDTRGAAIIRSIANGGTLKAAGESIGVSDTRASQILHRYCRHIGLSSIVSEIKSNPSIYLDKIGEITEIEKCPIPQKTIRDLVWKLKLSSEDQLTPKYLSNITATQLLLADVSLTTVSDLQEWLQNSGLSLKRHAPERNEEIKAIRRAVNLLDAFCFDISTIRDQFSHLISE